MLWVHAENIARLKQNFRNIVDYIEISERQNLKANVFRLIHDWLRNKKSERWLLILDNLDNTDFIFEIKDISQREQEIEVNNERRQSITAYFFQSQNESILIISRSKDVALKLIEEKNIVAVQSMISIHALSLFEKKLSSLD